MQSFLAWLEDRQNQPLAHATSPEGTAVPFTMPFPKGRTIVMVDPHKLEPYWQANTVNYVTRGHNEIGSRIDDFGNWYTGQSERPRRPEQAVHAPEAGFQSKAKDRRRYQKGKVPDQHHLLAHLVQFSDGRHSYNWFKEQGWKAIPIAVDKKDAEDFTRMFGHEDYGPPHSDTDAPV